MASPKGHHLTPISSVLQWRRDCRQETRRKWTNCFASGIGNSAAWSRTNWLACMVSARGKLARIDRHHHCDRQRILRLARAESRRELLDPGPHQQAQKPCHLIEGATRLNLTRPRSLAIKHK